MAAIARQSQASKTRPKVNVVWFKVTDLRVHDNEALRAAHSESLPVLHIFVFDPFWYGRSRLAGFQRTGPRRAEFQIEAVSDLSQRLDQVGHKLSVRTHSSTADAFVELCTDFAVQSVFAFREICGEEQAIEEQVRQVLRQHGGRLQVCHGFELYHEFDLSFDPRKRRFGSFTSFRKTMQDECAIRPSLPLPDFRKTSAASWAKADQLPRCITELGYDRPAEPVDFRAEFKVHGGETAALDRIDQYLFKTDALELDYVGATMTYDASKSTLKEGSMSKLSAWLSHGCISPRFLYEEVTRYEKKYGRKKPNSYLLHELVWRDFSRYASLQAGNKIFKLGGLDDEHPTWGWSNNAERLRAWTEGNTGYPYVDAAMRELKSTGYCNHMGREVCGWFLVLDLGLDWRLGAEWFESQFIDYEPCANWFNWVYHVVRTVTPNAQKARGWDCPAATKPMSLLQTTEVLFWGAQHDPDAHYIKKWIPELAGLPATLAREPWFSCTEKRKAPDGGFYSKEMFREYFGDDTAWEAAGIAESEDVNALVTMGFDRAAAKRALKNTGMEIDLAVAMLVEQIEAEPDKRPGDAFRYGQDYPKPILAPASLHDSEGVADDARRKQRERTRRAELARQKLQPNCEQLKEKAVAVLASHPSDARPDPPAERASAVAVRKRRWGKDKDQVIGG